MRLLKWSGQAGVCRNSYVQASLTTWTRADDISLANKDLQEIRGPIVIWPQIQLQNTNPTTAKGSAFTKIPTSSQSPVYFSATLDMDKFSSFRDIQLSGVPRGRGESCYKKSPFLPLGHPQEKGWKTELN